MGTKEVLRNTSGRKVSNLLILHSIETFANHHNCFLPKKLAQYIRNKVERTKKELRDGFKEEKKKRFKNEEIKRGVKINF